MIKTHLSPRGTRRWRVLALSGAASALAALAALAAASPALARPNGPILFEGPVGPTAGQTFQSTAVDASGDAVIVWNSTDGAGNYFESASVRPAGGEWSAPVKISGDAYVRPEEPGMPSMPPATEASVAFGPDGEAVAVWSVETETGHTIEAATLPTIEGTWGQPVALTSVAGEDYDPSVAIGPEGTAVAAWSSNDTEAVEAAELPSDATTWSQLGELSRPRAIEHAYGPIVKFDAKGDLMIAWRGADVVLHGARPVVDYRPAGQAFEGPVMPWATANSMESLDLGIDGAGDATLIWTAEQTGGVYALESAELLAGGSWSAASVLDAENSRGAHVAVAPGGEAVVVWQTANGQANVEADSRSFAGAPWGTIPTALTSFTRAEESGSEPNVTIGEEGGALVTWNASTPSGGERQEASMRLSDGTWEALGQISEEHSEGPALAGNSAGESIASWVHEGELETVVYDHTAPRFSSLVIPTEGTVGVPVEFEAEAQDMTHVGIEWEAGNGEEAGGPVAGFVYAEPGTYTVTVTAEDRLGNVATRTGEITIKAASSGGGETPSGGEPSTGGETKTGGDSGDSTTTSQGTTSSGSTPSAALQSTPIQTPTSAPAPSADWLKLVQVARSKPAGDGSLLLEAPGKGTMTVSGPGVKKATIKVTGKGAGAKLTLTPKGAFKRQLASHRRGWTTVKVAYTPAGGGPTVTATRRVRLVKR